MPEGYDVEIYQSIRELVARYPDKTEQIGYVLGLIENEVNEIEENTLNPIVRTVDDWLKDQGYEE